MPPPMTTTDLESVIGSKLGVKRDWIQQNESGVSEAMSPPLTPLSPIGHFTWMIDATDGTPLLLRMNTM